MRAFAATPGITAVKSGQAIGKSRMAAGLVIWALSVFDRVAVLTTAPTHRQVVEVLWREIAMQLRAARIPIEGHLTTARLERSPSCFALGLSTTEPEKFQGVHAAQTIVIIDEAAGVDGAIFEAALACTTGPQDRILLLGNPTTPQGYFFDCFTGKVEAERFTITSWAASKAGAELGITGLASRKWCLARRRQWGVDSPVYVSRVLGQFPQESSDALIKLRWVHDAMAREPKREGEVVIGLDVARHGDSRTVWAIRQGDDIIALHDAQGLEVTAVAGRTFELVRQYGATDVIVDETGVGGGVSDILQERQQAVTPITFGARSSDDRFLNLRIEIWWNLAEWLREGRGALPPHDHLLGDLTAPRRLYRADDKIQLESKDRMRSRLKRSPDFGDAVALALHHSGASTWSGGYVVIPRGTFGRHPEWDDYGEPPGFWRDRDIL